MLCPARAVSPGDAEIADLSRAATCGTGLLCGIAGVATSMPAARGSGNRRVEGAVRRGRVGVA